MLNTDKPEFVRVLTGLASIKRVDMTTEAFELWWQVMQDWDIAEFKQAAGHLLKQCEFMPQPHDFEKLARAGEDSAQESWAKVLEHCKGGYRYGKLACDRTNAVVQGLGGYQAIALMQTEKLGYVQHRFVEMFEDFTESDIARQALPDHSAKKRLGNAVPLKAIVGGLKQ